MSTISKSGVDGEAIRYSKTVYTLPGLKYSVTLGL